MASLGHCDDLTTTTFTIFGTLNDTGEIENLNFRTVVQHLAGNGCQGCELVCGGCESEGQFPFSSTWSIPNIPSECWPVNLLIKVLLPTEGKPMKPLLRVSLLLYSKIVQSIHTHWQHRYERHRNQLNLLVSLL